MLEPQRRLAAKTGKEKREASDAREEETAAAVRDAVLSLARERLDALYAEEIQSKSARGKKMAELKDAVFAELVGAMANAGDAGSVGQTVADAVAVARRRRRRRRRRRGPRGDEAPPGRRVPTRVLARDARPHLRDGHAR